MAGRRPGASTKTRLDFEGAVISGRPIWRRTCISAFASMVWRDAERHEFVKVRPFGSGFFIFSDYARARSD